MANERADLSNLERELERILSLNLAGAAPLLRIQPGSFTLKMNSQQPATTIASEYHADSLEPSARAGNMQIQPERLPVAAQSSQSVTVTVIVTVTIAITVTVSALLPNGEQQSRRNCLARN